MSVEQGIESKLRQALAPDYLEVVNESHMHGGSATDSHFKVIIVSTHFTGQRLLARHRQVNQLLADELAGPVHALAIHTYSPEEWEQASQAPDSPACLGGSK